VKQSKLLASRLDEVLLNGTWIANTNFKSQIESITWKQAITRIDSLNTIASLVFHVNYYLKGLNQVFGGGALEIRDKYSFDMPPILGEADWKTLVDDFIVNAISFIQEVEKVPDAQLDEPFVDDKYGTYLRNIEGVIEHSYYHLGQISLIKRLVLETPEGKWCT
jgi:hypothetical protein